MTSPGAAADTSAATSGTGGSTASATTGGGGVTAMGDAGATSGVGGAGAAAGIGGNGGLAETSGMGGSGMAGSLGRSQCENGALDGDETGVDCGGSCDACPDYHSAPPLADNEDARSGCEAGGTGFMCAQAMVFTPHMIQAAKDDWNSGDPPFVYGVVGHDPDEAGVDGPSSDYASTCCQCYQLVFKGPRDGNVSVPLPKPMIVQAFNTFAGGPTAFDVFMAVGGHGNFNGCTENGMQYSGYPDTGDDWSGGVRATRYAECAGENGYTAESIGAQQCQDHIAEQCSQIQAPEPVQSISQQSCTGTNRVESHYHMNWNVVVKRVECPENLTRVTGCRLNLQGLPEPDPSITDAGTAVANGFLDNDYHTTTMQDCCRPTCAWPQNTTNTDPQYSLFYSCDAQGNPYTQ